MCLCTYIHVHVFECQMREGGREGGRVGGREGGSIGHYRLAYSFGYPVVQPGSLKKRLDNHPVNQLHLNQLCN